MKFGQCVSISLTSPHCANFFFPETQPVCVSICHFRRISVERPPKIELSLQIVGVCVMFCLVPIIQIRYEYDTNMIQVWNKYDTINDTNYDANDDTNDDTNNDRNMILTSYKHDTNNDTNDDTHNDRNMIQT